jgi:tripartite-type tricarboxylate transporter receptor subunit TctC
MKSIIVIASIIFAVLGTGSVYAQEYPNKPIRLINPWQVGGGVDNLARLLGSKFQERLGQPVIVESKTGAGGTSGADFVAKSAPDGHTLLITTGALTTSPFFFAKMPFDVEKDLAPVSMVARQHFYLVAANNTPVKNMKDLIAYAKANPGKLTYASPGIGTPQHLAGEMLKLMAGIDIIHVPYKGQAPAMNDVMAGHVQMTWVTLNAALPLIQTGKVRGIGIASSKERLALYKDVPVIAETVPGYEMGSVWYSLFAPAATPARIIQQLAAEVHRFTQLPDMQEKLVPLGFELQSSTPQALRAAIKSELGAWGKVVKAAGIKPE